MMVLHKREHSASQKLDTIKDWTTWEAIGIGFVMLNAKVPDGGTLTDTSGTYDGGFSCC